MLPDTMLTTASPLPPHERGRIALGVASLLTPLLDLDPSPHGQRRATVLRQVLVAVSASKCDGASLLEAIAALEAGEELTADEEPDGPAAFRVDFAAALLYAVRALAGSDDDFRHVWSRASDSIGFLVDYAKRDL